MPLSEACSSTDTFNHVLRSAPGERLQTLTYRGLDPRFGMDLPAQLEQGRSGMARGYTHENEAPPGREVDE